jgi:hypothetical protein
MADRSTTVQPFSQDEIRNGAPAPLVRQQSVSSSKRTSIALGSGRRGSDGTDKLDQMVKHAEKYNALDNKHGEVKKALFATFFLLVTSVILNGIAVLFVVQGSKENHTVGGELLDLDGDVVKVGSVESLGHLFDMPYLSIDTLKKLDTVTVVLPGNKEYSFRVEMVEKMCSGNSVILHTPQGNSININGFTKAALVSVGGDVHQIQGSERRRLLTSERPVQLYTQDEFFVSSHGWEGTRRLAVDDDGPEGWANFALSAEDAMITSATDANFCAGEPYFGVGKATVQEGGTEADMLYLNNAADRTMYIQTDDTSVLYADCSEDGKNVDCRATGSYLWRVLPGQNDLLQCNDYTVFAQGDSEPVDTATVETTLGEEDEDVDIQLGESLVFEGKPCKELLAKYPAFPGFTACRAANENHAASTVAGRKLEQLSGKELLELHYGEEVQRHLSEVGHRHLGASQFDVDMAKQSYDTYTHCADGYWGSACVLVSDCNFAFRGSDDISDWLSNAGGIFTASVNNLHAGFNTEFNKLKGDIDAAVGACPNPKFIGHSLGGAMATVAHQTYGKGTVATFGAPQLFDNNPGCAAGGYRLYHEEDPVAGNVFGLNAGYWHGTMGTEIYWKCTQRNWLGICKNSSYKTRDTSCSANSGTWDTNVNAHSMADQYAHNFDN